MKTTSTLNKRSWFYVNLANFVTVTRLLLSFWLICLAIWNPTQIGFMCLLAFICALSDLLDGYLARKLAITSQVGGFLDRVSDKIFICSLIIFIAWGYQAQQNLPGWLESLTQGIVGVIIFFEITLMVIGVWGSVKGENIYSNKFGKIKMTLESVAVIFWFVALLADTQWRIGMYWPVVITDVILVVSIFYALKSIQGYADNYRHRTKINH